MRRNDYELRDVEVRSLDAIEAEDTEAAVSGYWRCAPAPPGTDGPRNLMVIVGRGTGPARLLWCIWRLVLLLDALMFTLGIDWPNDG